LQLPTDLLRGCVPIEVTEIRGVRAKNDRFPVQPLPVGIQRKGLVGYDVADYDMFENRGSNEPLWSTPDLAFQALRARRLGWPATSAVFAIYELDLPLERTQKSRGC